jgi:hypothetical protein
VKGHNGKRAVNRHQTQSKASAGAQERAIEKTVRQAVAKEIRRQQQAPVTCYLHAYGATEGSNWVAVRVVEMPFAPTVGMELVVGPYPEDPELDVEMVVVRVAFDLTTETLDVDLDSDDWTIEELEGWGFLADQPQVLKRAVEGNVLALRPEWTKEKPV